MSRLLKSLLLFTLHLSAVTSPDEPVLELNCVSTYNNDGTINIYAIWKIPEETWLKEAIKNFEVHPSLVDISRPTSPAFASYDTIILDIDVSDA